MVSKEPADMRESRARATPGGKRFRNFLAAISWLIRKLQLPLSEVSMLWSCAEEEEATMKNGIDTRKWKIISSSTCADRA